MTPPACHCPDPPALDRLGFRVRAVCGALLGTAVGTGIRIHLDIGSPLATTARFTASIAACVCGAVRHGDAFWVAMLRMLAGR